MDGVEQGALSGEVVGMPGGTGGWAGSLPDQKLLERGPVEWGRDWIGSTLHH